MQQARLLARNTAYPQQDKGTETAHGTHHTVNKQRYADGAFNMQNLDQTAAIRRLFLAKKPAWWETNMQDNAYNNKTVPMQARQYGGHAYIHA